jgi:hypothetical protein
MQADDLRSMADDISAIAPEVLCQRRIGRPTAYTEALGEEIIVRIEEGEVLEQIAADERMPTRRTINRWIEQHIDFCQRYARARTKQAAAVAEHGYVAAWADDGPEHVQRNRLRFDAARWLAGRLDPSRWSDKPEVSVHVSDAATNERRAELIAALQRMAVAAPLIDGETTSEDR